MTSHNKNDEVGLKKVPNVHKSNGNLASPSLPPVACLIICVLSIFVETTNRKLVFPLLQKMFSIGAVPLPAGILSNTDPCVHQADAL